MKNIICVNLTQYNELGIEKLISMNPILEDISLSYNSLIKGDKRLDIVSMKKMGYDKLFIDSSNGLLISYTLKGKDKSIKVNENLLENLDLSSIKTLTLPGKKLNSDLILEKIFKSGMESLSERELNFLKVST